MMKLYKVLTDDLKSPYKGFQYEIGREYVCDDFNDDPNKVCAGGFYAVDIDGLIYPWQQNGATTVVPVEVGGRSVEIDEFKRRYEKMKITGPPLTQDEIIKKAQKVELPYCLKRTLWPTNPLEINPPEIKDRHIERLRKWDSVCDSAWDSVWASDLYSARDSVWYVVGDSVGSSDWDFVVDLVLASVGDSVWATVGDSVMDSVGAYIGSLFHKVDDWKNINHDPGEYPFQPAVYLWNDGLVPSFYGETWRLHGGPDAEVLFEINKTKLEAEE